MWVADESRHVPLGLVRRVGRAAAGWLLVLVGVPIAVLMPLFWLETVLPPEAGCSRILAPVMALILIALALVWLVNLVGRPCRASAELARLGRLDARSR